MCVHLVIISIKFKFKPGLSSSRKDVKKGAGGWAGVVVVGLDDKLFLHSHINGEIML